VLIAGVSNFLAVRKYLNTKIDNLYLWTVNILYIW
jgi:hypothetical protein